LAIKNHYSKSISPNKKLYSNRFSIHIELPVDLFRRFETERAKEYLSRSAFCRELIMIGLREKEKNHKS